MPQNNIRSKNYQHILKTLSVISFLAFIACVHFSITYLTFPLKLVLPLIWLIIFIALAFFSEKEGDLHIKSIVISVCEEFGRTLYSESQPIQFERNTAVFSVSILKTRHIIEYIVSFNAPPIEGKFFIQNKSIAASLNYAFEGGSLADCQPIDFPDLTENFTLQSSNPDFLLLVLDNEKILSEIAQYKTSDWMRFIRITFENGHFEINWHTDVQADVADGLRRILHTTILFHEVIKALTEE